MASKEVKTGEGLRRGFKYFNYFMIMMWRLGLGSWINLWPEVGGRIMVICHRGRKTGKKRLTPVNYAKVGEEIFCTAGFGETSDWYRNILHNPDVEIWLPDGWWAGIAKDVTGAEYHTDRMRQVLIGSGIVAPLFGIDPRKLTDQQLATATDGYRLIHIQRTEARTGTDGPGDLAWVWPLSLMFLIPYLIFRRRSK
jgi:deazaflavin-dependent oxidoreductase (nitroreductase family)